MRHARRERPAGPAARARTLACRTAALCAASALAIAVLLVSAGIFAQGPREVGALDRQLCAIASEAGGGQVLDPAGENAGGEIVPAVESALSAAHPDWVFRDGVACDVDGDGADEAILLVEKPGSFGTSRPFWVEDDPDAYGSHVFVYRMEAGSPRPVWMSSDLGVEVRSLRVGPDGSLVLTAADGSETCWRWSGWGFELIAAPDADARAAQGFSPGGSGSATGAGTPGAASPGSGGVSATLVVAGDNIAHASLLSHAFDPASGSYAFSPIYDGIRDIVSAADLAVVTQETVLVGDAAPVSGYPAFATPSSMGDALAGAGFDMVLSATNHVLDQGVAAIDGMIAYWAAEHPDVIPMGVHPDEGVAEEVRVVDAGGIRIACLDYTYGLNAGSLPADLSWKVDVLDDEGRARLLEQVRRVERGGGADVTACFLHIGEEYSPDPPPGQAELVAQLVEAGADLIFCSHSHVLGPYGRLAGPGGGEAVVFYGLGNLVAHQDDPATVVGGLAVVVLEKGAGGTRVRSFELVPTVCHVTKACETRVYPLASYTDDLAAGHILSTEDDPLSVARLRGYVPERLRDGL